MARRIYWVADQWGDIVTTSTRKRDAIKACPTQGHVYYNLGWYAKCVVFSRVDFSHPVIGG